MPIFNGFDFVNKTKFLDEIQRVCTLWAWRPHRSRSVLVNEAILTSGVDPTAQPLGALQHYYLLHMGEL